MYKIEYTRCKVEGTEHSLYENSFTPDDALIETIPKASDNNPSLQSLVHISKIHACYTALYSLLVSIII